MRTFVHVRIIGTSSFTSFIGFWESALWSYINLAMFTQTRSCLIFPPAPRNRSLGHTSSCPLRPAGGAMGCMSRNGHGSCEHGDPGLDRLRWILQNALCYSLYVHALRFCGLEPDLIEHRSSPEWFLALDKGRSTVTAQGWGLRAHVFETCRTVILVQPVSSGLTWCSDGKASTSITDPGSTLPRIPL